MTLVIMVATDGRLFCSIPEQDYSYIVQSWAVFFAATGTAYIADYDQITIRIAD